MRDPLIVLEMDLSVKDEDGVVICREQTFTACRNGANGRVLHHLRISELHLSHSLNRSLTRPASSTHPRTLQERKERERKGERKEKDGKMPIQILSPTPAMDAYAAH